MTDLDKMIEAVEAVRHFRLDNMEDALPPDPVIWDSFIAAFNGSLDAAKALHEALLSKDCHFNLMEDEDAGGYQAGVYLNGWQYAGSSCPSRAWLIAILKAYRAQQP